MMLFREKEWGLFDRTRVADGWMGSDRPLWRFRPGSDAAHRDDEREQHDSAGDASAIVICLKVVDWHWHRFQSELGKQSAGRC